MSTYVEIKGTGLSPSSALTPQPFEAQTPGNPYTAHGAAGVPYTTQNPSQDLTRMYNPAYNAIKAAGATETAANAASLQYIGNGHYSGPVAVPDNSQIGQDPSAGFNQVMMEVSRNFELMIQLSVQQHPSWWHDRIPRSAYPLFNGTVQETRIFRGSIMKYVGLDEWQDIDPYPTRTNNPCAALGYNTPTYGWEALSWRGKRAAWGSDPICSEQFKFFHQAQEQIGWILAEGAKYGIQMQEVWNRDMFIYQSVNFNRSFVMTSEYSGRGDSARFFYNPFIKFAESGPFGDGKADKGTVKGPFVLIDASVKIEPVNFDVLDKVRASLEIRCPDAAVSTMGGQKIFAIALSHDDIEKYVRGNEEERKYWIEANPQALIKHYDFTTPVFRRWSIVNDGNQIRLKRAFVIQKFDDTWRAKLGMTTSEALPFQDKPCWVAYPIDPWIPSPTRIGVNNTPIPEDNPDYIEAELAIAPVFMNQIFENQFVPSVTGLGSGTSFGPAPGLNGKWTWLNIRDRETNPLGNVGNFYGTFEIVPKPNKNVFHAISFLYRRCMTALPSFCPSENVKINPSTVTSTTTADRALLKPVATGADTAVATAILKLEDMLKCAPGDMVTVSSVDMDDSGSDTDSAYSESDTTLTGYVIATPTARSIEVQFEGLTAGKMYGIPKGAAVSVTA